MAQAARQTCEQRLPGVTRDHKNARGDLVEDGLRYRIAFFGPPLPPGTRLLADEENELVRSLDLLYRFVDTIRSTNELQLAVRSKRTGKWSLPSCPEKTMLQAWLSFNIARFDSAFRPQTLNPVLQELSCGDPQVMERRTLWSTWLNHHDVPKDIVDEIHNELASVKIRLAGSELKKRERRFLQRSDQNRTSAFEYVGKLFAREHVLDAVRLSLGYPQLMQVDGELKPNQIQPSISVANYHLGELFRYLNQHFFPQRKGYIARLEYCQSMGPWYHCLIFFPPMHEAELIDTGERIGQCWVNAITHHKGTYHCWNTWKRAQAQVPGVGHITAPDELAPVIRYFTLLDRYLLLPAHDEGRRRRTLFMGQIRQIKKRPLKRGRRKK